MHHRILAAGVSDSFVETLIPYLLGAIALFFIGLYLFRAIFNIPSFLRYQKAQLRMLEEIAKKQGVDDKKVQNIISESVGWDQQGTASNAASTNDPWKH